MGRKRKDKNLKKQVLKVLQLMIDMSNSKLGSYNLTAGCKIRGQMPLNNHLGQSVASVGLDGLALKYHSNFETNLCL